MLEHYHDTARPGHAPKLGHKTRTLSRVDMVHYADGDDGIERTVCERKPIAIVHHIGNAGVALDGSSDAFSADIDASQRTDLIDPVGMVIADSAADIEQVDFR